MQVPSGCRMTGAVVQSAGEVLVGLAECDGLRGGVVSGNLAEDGGGRSATARVTGREDDEQVTASASTTRMPWSVRVHLS